MAPERPKCQQHQGQQQPIALVLPGQAPLAANRPAAGRADIEHAQGAQVGVIGGEFGHLAASRLRQRPQRCGVEPHLPHIASPATHRCAAGPANAQHRNPIALRRGFPCGGDRCIVHATGHQQDIAFVGAPLLQQLAAEFDGACGVVAIDRHDLGRQCIDEQGHVGRVGRQRRHRMRVVGIGHQRHLPVGARFQQLAKLGARLQQSRWRHIVRIRGAGQIKRDHQRPPALPQGLR